MRAQNENMDEAQKEQNQLNSVYFILSGEFAAY